MSRRDRRRDTRPVSRTTRATCSDCGWTEEEPGSAGSKRVQQHGERHAIAKHHRVEATITVQRWWDERVNHQ